MTPEAALIELLVRVGVSNGATVSISTEELKQWPAAAISALKSQGLLLNAHPAKSVECPGCEQACSMPVHTPPRTIGPVMSFVVCDKRSDINRVHIPAARLALWRCDAKAVSGFVTTCLGLQQTTLQSPEVGLLPLGMARGDKRSQMLCLRVHGNLALVVGTGAMPLVDLVSFENGRFSLDEAVIFQMVDAATIADPRYTPSMARRETSKLDTQDRYAGWRTAYRALRKKHLGKSDVWYSQQIAKTPIAQDRNARTIKKHMKSKK